MITEPLKTDAGARPETKLRILCVDDESHVLEGLSLHLRRRYDVVRASSGAAGLDILHRDATIGIVISDMRMPGMDGPAFLARARQAVPDAVRLLLTGQSQFESAVAAVNDGRIFRLLTKPCPPATLIAAIDSAADHHRALTTERLLLRQTLHGAIQALTDVLALTNPMLFGRASRAKQRAVQIAEQLGIVERWPIEVAAMLSQLGTIALPADTVERLHSGETLAESERQMVARTPAVAEQILCHIPRLEVVRGILATYANPYMPVAADVAEAHREQVTLGAKILRTAIDFDTLEDQGQAAPLVLEALRAQPERHDSRVLDALQIAIARASGEEIRDLALADLQVGMVLAEDVRLTTGMLIASRGHEVTHGFVMRANNFRENVKEPIRVITARAASDPGARTS